VKTQITKIPVSGAILIGGKSNRFKKDKTYITLDGEYLSSRLFHTLDIILDNVFFVANQDKSSPVPGAKFVLDLHTGVGPIGGVYSALTYSHHDFCFISACDLPFLSVELIKILWQHTRSTDDIIVPVWDSKVEPLSAIYHRRCIPQIESALAAGQYMTKGFWNLVNTQYLDISRFFSRSQIKQMFININSPEDYKHVVNLLKKT
jgi:molybdopterin-guanine dinucleotide biosynthesis protein A